MKAKLVLAVLVLAAGLAVAAVVARNASAWDINALPPNCHAQTVYDTSGPTWDYRVNCDADNVLLVYGTNQPPAAPTNPDFQAQLDAFVDAHPYTAPATTTAPTTTDTTNTTTASPTTPTPVSTTTAVPGQQPPASAFTVSPAGLVVNFADSSTPGTAPIQAVSWQFGDGATGFGANASHAYVTSGTFSVVEIVTDANGLTSQASQTISVSPFDGHAPFAETKNAALATATTTAFGQLLAVYCVGSWGSAKPENGYGLSIVGSHQANIWSGGCKALATKNGPVALSLLVLGHEVAHALGIASERTADCYSVRRLPKLETALHIADHGYRTKEAALVRKKWGRC